MLPSALLACAFGWLPLRDIQAAQLACVHWSTVRAVCPHLLGVPPPNLVQSCRLVSLDLDDYTGISLSPFTKLERVAMKNMMCPSRQLAHLLHTVECASPTPLLLNWLLGLPNLKTLVLHQARVQGTLTPPLGRSLENVVFVRCGQMDVAFLEQLPHLRSLKFVQLRPLQDKVPISVRGRIESLDVHHPEMMSLQQASPLLRQEWRALNFQGYENLRHLRLESTREHQVDWISNQLLESISTFNRLETLELYTPVRIANFVAGMRHLTSLDVSFRDWSSPDFSHDGLRALSIRDIPPDFPHALTLKACPRLERLRLSSQAPAEVPTQDLPSWLQVLELDGVWPSSDLTVPTVCIEAQHFARLPDIRQARMRKAVKNLFIVADRVIL